MAVAVTGTPNVQTVATSGTDKTLTFTSQTYGAGEIILVIVAQNAGGGAFPDPQTPTGGGLSWNSIANVSGTAGNFTRTTAWWAHHAAGGTHTVAQTTNRSGATTIGVQGVLVRLTGANTTTPIGATDTHQGTASDPLTSNTNLQLTTSSADSMLFAAGCNWAATNISVSFDSSLAATTLFNNTEAGEAAYCAFRTTNALGAADADVRAQMDAAGGTGNWSAIFFEVEAAAGAAAVPRAVREANLYQTRGAHLNSHYY